MGGYAAGKLTDGKSDTIVYSTWVLPGSAIDQQKCQGCPGQAIHIPDGLSMERIWWNMADDKVEEALTLAAKWTLNTPEVTIKADKTEAKAGETIHLDSGCKP